MFTFDNDQMFVKSYDPISTRLPVPLSSVLDQPTQCLEFNQAWGPYIAKALERLLYWDAWDGTDEQIKFAHQNVEHLINLLTFGECVGSGELPQCYDLALYAPNVEWQPMNPFSNPDERPFGWTAPPWLKIVIPEIGSGLRAGDVITDITRYVQTLPPFIPPSGFPRVQVWVDGSGELDITLLKVPAGGIASIYLDDVHVHDEWCSSIDLADLGNVSGWIELFGDMLMGKAFPEVSVQIPVHGVGLHHVGVEMRPLFSTTSLLGFGGGLRALQWCGGAIPAEINGVITDIRVSAECGLEKLQSGVWSAIEGAQFLPLDVTCELQDGLRSVENTAGSQAGLKIARTTPPALGDSLSMIAGYGPNAGGALTPTLFSFQGALNNATPGSYASRALLQLTDVNVQQTIQEWANNNWGVIFDLPDLQQNGVLIRPRSVKTGFPMFRVDRDFAGNELFRVNETGRSIHTILNGLTNGIDQALEVFNNTANPVNGIGAGLWLFARSSTGNKRPIGRFGGALAIADDATRSGLLHLSAYDYIGSADIVSIRRSAGASYLGFYGGQPVTKPVISGTTLKDGLLSLAAALASLNLATNNLNISGSGVPEYALVGNSFVELTRDGVNVGTVQFPTINAYVDPPGNLLHLELNAIGHNQYSQIDVGLLDMYADIVARVGLERDGLEMFITDLGVRADSELLPEYRLDRPQGATLLKLYRDGTTLETSAFLPFYDLECVYPSILRWFTESDTRDINLEDCATAPFNCPGPETYAYAKNWYSLIEGSGLDTWEREAATLRTDGLGSVPYDLPGQPDSQHLIIHGDWSECGPLAMGHWWVRINHISGDFLAQDGLTIRLFKNGDLLGQHVLDGTQSTVVIEGNLTGAEVSDLGVECLTTDETASWILDYMRIESDDQLTCGPGGWDCTE